MSNQPRIVGLQDLNQNNQGFFQQRKPLKENYNLFDLLKFYFFPQAKIKSFSFIITIIQTVIFFLLLFIDGIDKNPVIIQTYFLPIRPFNMEDFTLNLTLSSKLQLSQTWLKENYAYYNLLTSHFINVNFNELFTSAIICLLFIDTFQELLDLKIFLIIFFATGTITNFFIAACLKNWSVSGILSCVAGTIGSFVGYLYCNWQQIKQKQNSQEQTQIIFYMAICIVFFLVQGLNSEYQRYVSFGGFLIGVIFGFAIHAQANDQNVEVNKRNTIIRIVAISILTLIVILSFVIIYI